VSDRTANLQIWLTLLKIEKPIFEISSEITGPILAKLGLKGPWLAITSGARN
jgi:hypothetical protein